MMLIKRRDFLGTSASAFTPMILWAGKTAKAEAAAPKSRLGVVIHSYGNKVAADRSLPAADRIDDPFRFLANARKLGLRAIQLRLGGLTLESAMRLEAQAEMADIAVEGIVQLPRNRLDAEAFRHALSVTHAAGARIARCVLMDGRRYETLHSAAELRQFAERAEKALRLAVPIAEAENIQLAVENHKDLRTIEFLALLERIESEKLGVCLDTGNSMALLEDPHEVIDALAPWALTTHFKDMAVRGYDDGFLLSEVPLGTGVLDLPRVVQKLEKARPGICFQLEMITRDPLRIPCLTEPYWTTLESISGRDLMRALAAARKGPASRQPLQEVSNLDIEGRLRVEAENVARSLHFAREKLGLA